MFELLTLPTQIIFREYQMCIQQHSNTAAEVRNPLAVELCFNSKTHRKVAWMVMFYGCVMDVLSNSFEKNFTPYLKAAKNLLRSFDNVSTNCCVYYLLA